jgi:uncharacterized membrane protein
MALKAAITIYRDREEVERRWRGAEHPEQLAKAQVTFTEAPGDRGTEVHVALEERGAAGKVMDKVLRAVPLALLKDDLRRFKQVVETGVVVRSDAVPEGERFTHKLKSHPAQPLDDAELQKVGA